MKIPKNAIQDFKELYFKRFSAHLTDEEAVEMSNELLNLVAQIYKPIKKTKNERGDPP